MSSGPNVKLVAKGQQAVSVVSLETGGPRISGGKVAPDEACKLQPCYLITLLPEEGTAVEDGMRES
jgi:hypothetical protein